MKRVIVPLFVLLMSGCAITQKAGYDYKPKIAESKLQRELDLVPPPANGKLTIAVYQFADKTGQRKAVPGIASFSTAVTQGGDALLIRALQDVGQGTWFDVVERGNIDALTKERLIITQMRQAYEGKDAQKLMPLTFAGIIVEGGVIGYDTGLESGGVGYNFLGIGPTTQYSKDIVTVSLRAVSVNTGKVLATVTVTKVIYSTADSIAIFKSVDPQGSTSIVNQVMAGNIGSQSATAGILQFESGLTINEATTLGLKTTIEAAVVELINEGRRKGVWDFKPVPPLEPTASERVGKAVGATFGVLTAPVRAVGDLVESSLGGTLDDNMTKGWEMTSPSRLVKPDYKKEPAKTDAPTSVAPVVPDPGASGTPNIPLGMSAPTGVPADEAAKMGVVK
jgi:curli production assembly/transport component CsgG